VTVAWLWLYGPPGVGKSATGFELFEQLVESGERVAFVELDQIGMCMPAPVAARSAAKADNLLGILDNFAAAGANGVIVCGDIAETMGDLLTRARERPVLCRLRADDDVTVERLTIRKGVHYAMLSSVYESYEVPAGDLDVTTHPLGVNEVAAEIVRRLGPWPPASTVADVPAPLAPSAIDDSSAILVTGPRAVGTSMVAWQVLMASVGSGHCTGYLDLEQLGFLPAVLQEASLATKLANVATCWAGFRDQGAERLVLCAHVDGHELGAVRELMPSLRVVALTAAPDTLRERAGRRSRQKDIWLPGDDLFGRDEAYLREVVRQAATFEPEHADLVVETDSLTPADVGACITPLWPGATTS
jgi:gluconate kinase